MGRFPIDNAWLMDTEVRINHADVAGGIKSEDIT